MDRPLLHTTWLRTQSSSPLTPQVIKVFSGDKGGSSLVYHWTLRMQRDGALDGCWMTDSVQPLGISS